MDKDTIKWDRLSRKDKEAAYQVVRKMKGDKTKIIYVEEMLKAYEDMKKVN